MCIVISLIKPNEEKRREAVKILAERHGITRVDEVYEDGGNRAVARGGV